MHPITFPLYKYASICTHTKAYKHAHGGTHTLTCGKHTKGKRKDAHACMHTDRQTDKCNLKSIYFYRLEHSVSAAFHFYLFSGIGSSLLVKMESFPCWMQLLKHFINPLRCYWHIVMVELLALPWMHKNEIGLAHLGQYSLNCWMFSLYKRRMTCVPHCGKE